MSNEYGPFDRFVELGVFLFVGYEVVIGILHRHKAAVRGKLVAKRIAEMRDLMSQGQDLQQSIPRLMDPQVDAWKQRTREWTEKCSLLLKSYSSHAQTAFLRHPPISPTFFGSNPAPLEFGDLVSRLSNLQNIIEKPDVYF